MTRHLQGKRERANDENAREEEKKREECNQEN